MDKKIEEMVNVMLEYALSIDGFSPEIKYVMQSVATTQAIKRALRGYATALINAGYRKIPENAVVLTRGGITLARKRQRSLRKNLNKD